MDKKKNKIYWTIFVIDLLKDVAFVPAIMSVNAFGVFIGIVIYIFDFIALCRSIYKLEWPNLLIGILVNLVTRK